MREGSIGFTCITASRLGLLSCAFSSILLLRAVSGFMTVHVSSSRRIRDRSLYASRDAVLVPVAASSSHSHQSHNHSNPGVPAPTFAIRHIDSNNGITLRSGDFALLKQLVRSKNTIRVREFCFRILRNADAHEETLSVHSLFTLMSQLGQVGDWEGAVLMFETIRSRQGPLQREDYMKVIRLLARLGRHAQAVSFWDTMLAEQISPSVVDLNKLFDILGRARQWPKLKAVYDQMASLGTPPNQNTFTILAYSAAISAPWSEVLRILDDAVSRDLASNRVFTMALKGLKERRNWKAAVALIHLMRSRGIMPDVVTYTAAVSACERARDASVVLSLMELMVRDGARPNQWTYSAAISACARGGRFDAALNLWEDLRAQGLKPTQILFNSMISACEHGQDLDRASSLLQSMIAEKVPRDVITYNSLISVCKATGDWARAQALLEEMRHFDGISPDTISYNAAIAACAKRGAMEEGRKLVTEMKLAGISRDTCTYNSLMVGYARTGAFGAVLQTMKDMKSEESIYPDVITYTQALSAAEKTRDIEAADQLLAAMKDAGVRWNKYTYAVVMALCEKTGRWTQAVKLLQNMRQRGMTPDSTCYTVVMKAAASACNFGQCLTLLRTMRADGVVPTIHIYTILLMASISADHLMSAWKLYKAMLQDGVQPNGVMLSVVLNALISSNRASLAKAILRRIRTGKVAQLDLVSYHIVLRQTCRQGYLQFARDLLQHMECSGISPDVTAYNFIMLGYAARGKAATTLALISEMKDKGLRPNLFTAINVVRACAVAGCPSEALTALDPSHPWEFWSAAITIFHQYGCQKEADAVLLASVQNGKAPFKELFLCCRESPDLTLNIEGLSRPVVLAAFRYALRHLDQRRKELGDSALGDLILISGEGKGGASKYKPAARRTVQDFFGDSPLSPLHHAGQPDTSGRIVISKAALVAWLDAKRQIPRRTGTRLSPADAPLKDQMEVDRPVEHGSDYGQEQTLGRVVMESKIMLPLS